MQALEILREAHGDDHPDVAEVVAALRKLDQAPCRIRIDRRAELLRLAFAAAGCWRRGKLFSA